MNAQPFNDADVLWRWTPTTKEKGHSLVLDEVFIVRKERYLGSFTVWGKRDQQWMEGYVHPLVVAELLRQLAERNEELELARREANKWHNVLRDGFRFTEGYPGPERVAYYWCADGGGPPNGWSVRDGMVSALQLENERLRAELGMLKMGFQPQPGYPDAPDLSLRDDGKGGAKP